MKILKHLLVVLVALASMVFGVLLLLQEEKEKNYINIYGEDSTY